VLQGQSFSVDSDQFFRRQIEDDFIRNTGAEVTVEFVAAADLPPRIAAAIQSGSGPDLLQLQNNWAHIYQDAIIDLSDVAADVRRATGDFYPALEAATNVGRKYLAVPHDFVGSFMHWRKAWFKMAGADRWPGTLNDLIAVGRNLKASRRPLGQALDHTVGDPPSWCYPLLWAYGGRELDTNGNLAINSAETIAAVRMMRDAWKNAFDETGFTWDDTSSSRSFLAGNIAATLNKPSTWWTARRGGLPFLDDIGLDLVPAGPKGRFVWGQANSYAVTEYSPSIEAAKAFIRWSMTGDVWGPWFEQASGYYGPVGPQQDDTLSWERLPPVTRALKNAGQHSRAPGSPGPYDARAALALSRYIVVDMFKRAVQGEAAEIAVAWAENELQRIYAAP
jgi:multiple sugar transport system substrate-binding protein